jgi:hypothetical protein
MPGWSQSHPGRMKLRVVAAWYRAQRDDRGVVPYDPCARHDACRRLCDRPEIGCRSGVAGLPVYA